MKIGLSERQLNYILSKIELDEQDNSAPKSGASTTQSGGQGYPQVGKWESGVTRGPANQLGNTKWSDVVGSSLKRGKANPLKESELRTEQTETESRVELMLPDGKFYYAPSGTNILKIFEGPKDNDQFVFKQLIDKSKGGSGNSQTQKWVPTDLSKYIRKNTVTSFQTPDGVIYKMVLRNTKLHELSQKYSGKYFWQYMYQIPAEPQNWKFLGYYDENKRVFKSLPPPPKSFWEEWKYWILAGSSILAAIIIPGIGGLIVSMGIDLYSSILQYIEGDTLGAGVSFILAFIPLIGKAMPFLKISEKTAQSLAQQLSKINNIDEIYKVINQLPEAERIAMQKLLSENPKKLLNIIDKELALQISNGLTRQTASQIVEKINYGIKNDIIDKVWAKKFINMIDLHRFGFDLGVSGVVMYVGAQINARLNQDDLFNQTPINKQVNELDQEVKNKNQQDYDMLYNLLGPYYEKYQNDIVKFEQLSVDVYQTYLKNPNQDWELVIKKLDKNIK